MARLTVADRAFDVDLVVFDKDGTLIDFHGVWGARALASVSALAGSIDADAGEAMLQLLGYEHSSGQIQADGILATLPHDVIERQCSELLIERGMPAQRVVTLIREIFAPVMRGMPEPDSIRLLDGIAALLDSLQQAGVAMGVLTADDRCVTEPTLHQLAIEDRFAAVVCGDDDIAAKPAPDGILHIARATGTDPQRVMMVGDTPVDMQAARAAGSVAVGLLTGSASAAQLRRYAAVLADSATAIVVM